MSVTKSLLITENPIHLEARKYAAAAAINNILQLADRPSGTQWRSESQLNMDF